MSTAYNSAPNLTYWWLDGYLDFTSEQKPAIKSELAVLHDWHRKNELPIYADFVGALQVKAVRDVDAAEVCQAFDEVRNRMRASSSRILPVTLKATVGLSDQQLVYLDKQFNKRLKKWREEWMDGTLQEQREHRVEEGIKNAEKFYGNLQDAQVDIIKANTAASSFDAQIVYRELERRQADTLQTLKGLQTSASQATAEAALQGLIARYMESPDPAYVKYFDTFSKQGCQFMARLHNATTPVQRARAVETLADYERKFRQLNSQR